MAPDKKEFGDIRVVVDGHIFDEGIVIPFGIEV